MIRTKISAIARFQLLVLYGTAMLLLPAIWNHYPLLNPDDNTYLLSGFLPETPFDRPITYGLLLRILSLNGFSLWLALFFQGYLMSWLILKITWRLSSPLVAARNALLIIPILTFTTGLSWVSSQLIPDLCTSSALLCLFLILLQKEKKKTVILLYCLFTLNVATHFSNVMIFGIITGFLFLFQKQISTALCAFHTGKSIMLAAILCFTTVAIMGSALSKSKHVFFTGAMLEQGILQTYLDEYCKVDSYKICAYRSELRKDANWFLWDNQSPLYKTGGWAANKNEYSKIINATLTNPRYIGLHIRTSLLFTGRQMGYFSPAEGNIPFSEGTTVHATIRKFLPRDMALFSSARQQQSKLMPLARTLRPLQYGIVLLSTILLLALLLMYRRKISAPLLLFCRLSILFIVVNNWDCATFAQVNDRYGCRVVWLIVFCSLLLLPHCFSRNSSGKRNNSSVKGVN